MRRILTIGLLLLLFPVAALAGGAGSIRLAQPLDRVNVGEVPLYVQALQHDQHPRDDVRVCVTAVAPDGRRVSTTAQLDPAHGHLHVWTASVPLDTPGLWRVTVQATHAWIHFPNFTRPVRVEPKSVTPPAAEPVSPFKGSHAHGESDPIPAECEPLTGYFLDPVAAETTTDTPSRVPTPAASARAPLLLGGGATVGAAALVALLLWRQLASRRRH